jgi:hypothetical protein
MIQKIFFTIFSLLVIIVANGQNVGIGTSTPDASSALEIKATTKGLLIPRTSTVSRTAIVKPAKGLMVYDTTTSSFWFHNGSAWVQVDTSGNGWSLKGNSATDTAVNFIGTTNKMPLLFKVNNINSGLIGINNGSLYLGYQSGLNEPPGFGNTGLGYQALTNNKNSTYSTAVGTDALDLDTSFGYNTAIGSLAMLQNRSGGFNTAVGAEALYFSEFGDRNTGVGADALYSDSLGTDNTGLGTATLFNNTQGSFNTAIGGYALYNSGAPLVGTSASSNTAVGSYALYANTSGSYNTSLGDFSLYTNTTGTYNTALGDHAAVGSGNLTNATAIGAGAIVNTSNSLILGSNANVGIGTSSPLANLHVNVSGTDGYSGIMISSSLSGGKQITINQGTAGKLNFTTPGVIDLVTMDFNSNNVGINASTPTHLLQLGTDDAYKPGTSTWGVLSDRRVKQDINPFTDGLNVVLKMQPVWFTYNGLGGTPKGEKEIGTVAQELQQLAPYMISEVKSSGTEDAGAKYLGVNYHALFFVLVNAIKEQDKTITGLQEENKAQQKINEELLSRVSKLESLVMDKK